MNEAIKETNFNFPGQTGFYRGKVRDVYYLNDLMVMIASDRISAFDVVLPRAIPHKGQVLNQIAFRNLQDTRDIVNNWVIASPDPVVTVGKNCEPYKIEMVIRGYLSGHAWREYKEGKRTICGVTMPEEMKENDKFPTPIVTPATKAEEGHDEDISAEEIITKNIVPEEEYRQLEEYTYQLFNRGTESAAKQGLILVDTKYEFGKYKDEIVLIDEIHTPDSSRYFYQEGYADRQNSGQKQKQLSKEFVREWLMENGFQGKSGQKVPEMSDEVVRNISDRYLELYKSLTGENIETTENGPILNRIEKNILQFLRENHTPH